MKILHVINSMTMGGAEILLTNSLSPGGLSEHVENHLAYFKFPTYLLHRLDKKIKVHFLNYKGITDIVRLVNDLNKIIHTNKIDIVHSHLNPASFYSELACPSHIPHLHTMHNTYSTDLSPRTLLKFFERILFFNKKNAKLIFLSEFTKKDFLSTVKFKGDSFVLNNFIDDSFFLHPQKKITFSADKEIRIVAVGNFRTQKNYFYLLDIFRKLKNRKIHLDIYGDGNIKKLQETIINFKINVLLKNPVKNINFILKDYDLFIMSSKNEGFPLSVFEAMAAGLPLLLSDIDPLKSIVKENAIYFPLNDSETAANIIIDISENKINVSEMAAKAKQYANQTVRKDIYIYKLINIYKKLIE